MNDDSMIKIMQSLDLNYKPAIDSTQAFQTKIVDLNKQLESMKAIAVQSAKEINNAFSSQLSGFNPSMVKEYNKMFANLEKHNKPVEVRVETDKAEIKMREFAKSMGITLDKNLRQQFTGLSSSLMGEFDEGKFKHLGQRIGVAFSESMNKEHKRISRQAIAETEEAYKFLTSYFKGGKGLDANQYSTKQAISEVDGFKQAMSGIAKISSDSHISLETLQADMQHLGVFASQNIQTYDEFAHALTRVVNQYREFKATGTIDGLNPLDGLNNNQVTEFVEQELMKLTTELAKIQYESAETKVSLQDLGNAGAPMKSINTILEGVKNEIKGLGVVTTQTFKDMNNETYKYIDTYKNMQKGISISDTYRKNDMGGFDFSGRVVNDKSMEVNYKSIQKAHAEALKLNAAFDQTIIKNQQLAHNDYWKSQFQNITKTSDEIKRLNRHYAEEEKSSALAMEKKHAEALAMNKLRDQEIAKTKLSNIEQMKAQAASVQQRVATKSLSQEYGKQAAMLRDQLAVIQNRLKVEGKLTSEEIRQTNEIKEQLNLLKAQTKTAVADDIRENPSTLGDEFDRRTSWFLTGSIFYGGIRAAKEATSTIKDVEMGMVELARVMNDSNFVFEDYRDNLLALGVEYGQTFENVQGIALRWAQSGYNVADSLELTKTSLLALNTAELDVTNSTESMIGIMAQWELQAEDMALVMDKINKTADNYSVTSQDLVDGLLRSSGAAKVMGMSIDDTIGTLTVLREATGRTGREVGNALNSILSYIQRPSSLNILESMGIQTFADEAKTEFRDVMEIFDELSSRWSDPSASEGLKNSLMAGAEEAGLFTEEMAATMDMYDEYTHMTDAASEAQRQFTDVQKRDAAQAAAGARRRNYFIGLLERFNKVQEVTTGLADAEGYSIRENADAMDTLEKKTQSLKTSMEQLAVAMGDAGLSDVLQGLASGATDAVEAVNELPDPLRDAILGFSNVFLVVKTLQVGMKTFGIQLPGITQMIGNLTTSTGSLTGALNAGAAGMAAFAKANAPLLILSATVGVIVAISNAVKKNREEQEKAIEVFKDYQATHSEIGGLINDYKELANQTSLTNSEEEKLISTKQKLIDMLPQSSTAIDNENLSLEEQIAILDKLNEQELQRLKNAAYKAVSKGSGDYEKNKKELDELTKQQKDLSEMMAELQRKNADGTITREELSLLSEGATLSNKYMEDTIKLKDAISAYENGMVFLNNELDINKEKTDGNIESTNNFGGVLKTAEEKMKELSDAFSESISKQNDYQSILDEINSKEGLSAKSKQEIIMKHQELAPYLMDENELRKKLIEVIGEQETANREAYKTMMNNDETYFTTLVGKNEWLRDQLAKLDKDKLANATTWASARAQIEANLIQTMSKAWLTYYNAISKGINAQQSVLNELRAERGIASPELESAISDASAFYTNIKALENLAGGVNLGGGIGSGSKSGGSSGSGGSSSASNKQMDEALRMLEHRKKLYLETYETIQAEIGELNRINDSYAKTQEERMTMAEKIYSAEQRYLDARLQNSVNWIADKKALDQLSTDEEIAAWERVRVNQADNFEAVKTATVNLHKLRNQLLTDSASKESSTIEHLKKLGILSTEEQIRAYQKMYEVKATSLEEERSRVENLFSLYKDLLSEQQDKFKDAYDKRIDMIDKQAEREKSRKEEKIKGIQEELELLNRSDSERSHEQTLASLNEDLQYWSVRTSEEARKKVIEIQKQIEEEKYKYNLEQQKQSLNDKIDVLKDEINEVDDAAKKEKEKWERSYKLTEKAFDKHSSNIIALARTMSKEAYEEWEANYLIPLQDALNSGDYGAFDDYSGRLEGSISDLGNKTSRSDNSQIKRLAEQILDYKKEFEIGGDRSAGDRAKSTYAELQRISPAVANMLHSLNYVSAKDYVRGLPKMHSGGRSLSYGAVEMMPGELVFPPDLSTKLETLISVLYRNPVSSNSNSLTDNRKEVRIDKLVNIERNYMEDEVDSDMFARELNRLVINAF